MPRHVGAGLAAYGVSNTLKSKAGGSFARSVRINPSDRKDNRVSAGYRTDQVDENTVHVHHMLGNKHGIASAADRVAAIEEHLAKYRVPLEKRFKVTLEGSGEQQYLKLIEPPNPAVAETLRRAAEQLAKLGNAATSKTLQGWAELAEQGYNW